MIDTITHKRLHVSRQGTAGSYIMVPEAQLAQVRNLLEKNNVRHWVDEEAISFDGQPEVAVINIGSGGNSEAVQKLLDGIP